MSTLNIDQTLLGNPLYYNNRELSWLAFNKRVLEEAIDERNPLLERLKFLAIFSSNLDEFFMVRVAGLKDQVKAGFSKPENKAGLTPKQQLTQIAEQNHSLVELQTRTFNELILPALKNEGITFATVSSLSPQQKKIIEKYFDEHIFPVLTPMAVDAYRPFPMLLNKSLNLVIKLEDQNESIEYRMKTAIVQVPAVLERFVSISPSGRGHEYVLLEDIIAHYIFKLFHGFDVLSVTPFRITRNADMTIHEEGARDLLKEIEKELKKRKWGAAVRLEVRKDFYDSQMMSYLLEELEIHKGDVYEIDGPLDFTFLFGFYKELSGGFDHLTYETFIPQPPKDLSSDDDIYEVAASQDLFLHHPYESFEPVIDFVLDAADDPDVLAIKQTLYRVSGGSPVIEALKRAAEKGKQVTVLVELKARFDEENNVQWAKELEKAGCHVIYGMTYLKTHSKITLVVRRKNNRIERFVHLGTGNYNDQTAKIYTDMSLITSNHKYGIDATNFFNYLSGYTEKPEFHHISIAPFDIRSDFLELVDHEIDYHKHHGNGKIIAKMNSLTDKVIIMKLYEASNAGVSIDLIVRGTCCLRPGIKGVSENIKVRSIVGRFLEHSRIYYFHHNGEGKMYLSSADMMTRNMEKRVEILFPIFDGSIKSRISNLLSIMLTDNVKAREQDSSGNYRYVSRIADEPEIDSQAILAQLSYRVSEDEE
ncbi:RNA degradosome polyphosphate kinase [Bacillus sp. V2I10]|uniref:RNA degradosome polyphosphate kinase n=1 Tax=Bacillus sp. V2I10 TaxID=3042276 RepID=UPI002780F9CB|nr:RNA degradosome polyphosphate kinase [Bacillus sp. V2I10]MDQ0860419.1 polyphosphate kinase [Bacillus sp. V2I10]